MNRSVFEYYQKKSDSGFEDVIVLEEDSNYSFEDVQKLAKNFPKAWFELTKLNLVDRIEFSRDFCLKTLPYSPHIYQLIYDFFLKLEDLSIIMTKKPKEPNFEVELVYSIDNESTFFRGKPPLDIDSINALNRKFNDILPRDFLDFFKIHNGFAKNADTGIIEAQNMEDVSKHMQNLITEQQKVVYCKDKAINPKDLIFFYQCYEKIDFQCFYLQWFPLSQIGNVYYSYVDGTISNYHDKNTWAENLAFPTFLDWLMFYLEIMEFE